MSIWNWLSGNVASHEDCGCASMSDINPATGLPMGGDGIGGFDVGGSPYGMDVHQDWPDLGHQDLASPGLGGDDWLTGS